MDFPISQLATQYYQYQRFSEQNYITLLNEAITEHKSKQLELKLTSKENLNIHIEDNSLQKPVTVETIRLMRHEIEQKHKGDESMKHETHPSAYVEQGNTKENRKAMAEYWYSPSNMQLFNLANNWSNIIVPGAVFLVCGLNPIALGVSFVATDAIMSMADTYICWQRPKSKLLSPITKRTKMVEKLTEKVAKLAPKYEAVCRKHNDKCRRCMKNSANLCKNYLKSDCRIISNYEFYKTLLEQESSRLKKEVQEMEENRAENEVKRSTEYQDKTEFLQDKRLYFEVLANKQKMTFLNPVCMNLRKLINLLKEKPIGYTLLPHNLTIYLDELTLILQQWNELSEERKKVYTKEITQVADALGDNIASLTKRIQALEEGNIEIGLKVLKSELLGSDDEEDAMQTVNSDAIQITQTGGSSNLAIHKNLLEAVEKIKEDL